MDQYRVLFDDLDWQNGIQGSRFKIFRSDSKQLRLLEITSDFEETEWCEKGHMGFVIKGELEIDFHGGLFVIPKARQSYSIRLGKRSQGSFSCSSDSAFYG